MGASIDKLEDTSGGDYMRHMPPQIGGENSIFLALNRGKRSFVLDLKNPRGREALLDLLPRYDVLIDQFRPGVLARLGLSHETLRGRHPGLVVCAITGYGQTGPLAHRAGHDLNYLARGGVLGFQGPKDGPPAVPGFQIADIGGALYCVVGVLAALLARTRTGDGAVVDVSMMEAAMGFAMSGFGTQFGAAVTRGDEPLTGGLACYRTYETKDGQYMSLGALEPKFWLAFAAGVGLEADMGALVPGPHQADLTRRVAEIFAARTRAEWEAFASERDCCLEPVLTPVEAMADAHVKARRLFFKMQSPWGEIDQMRLPFSREAPTRPPPRQGEHTEEILREAGFEDARIASLRAAGVLGG